MLALLLALPLIAGCWTPDLASLPEGETPFAPESESAPEGWIVTALTLGATCPDGEPARLYVVHPAEPEETPYPATVLYHSGALDLRTAPVAGDPTSGEGLHDPTRLTLDWSVRQVFATLGMYPDLDPTELHDGSLVAALANQGHVVLMPTNCWGDLWHNRQSVAENDFSKDLFFRNGRVVAEWAFQIAADPDFAATLGLTLPVAIDPAQLSLAGLGEGARAVGEVLVLQTATTPLVPDVTVFTALLDSPVEDLSAYQVNPLLYSDTLAALARIYPDGDVDAGSLNTARAFPKIAFVYSVNDTTRPQGANARLAERLATRTDHWIAERTEPKHVLSNGNAELAEQTAAFLATGEIPVTLP